MWIVRLALRRPYTIAVLALLILILGATAVVRMPSDIFPQINIPVVSVIWTYNGMPAAEMENAITRYSEASILNNVSDVARIESQTYNGTAVVRVYFQPTVNIQEALATTVGISQSIRGRMPPGTQPPIIVRYSATEVPVLQLGFGSDRMTESQVSDFFGTRIRPQLADLRGTRISLPFGGAGRAIMVDLDMDALLRQGISPDEVIAAVSAQNLVLPTGTVKFGPQQYTVRLNAQAELVAALNRIPVKTVAGRTIHMADVAHVRDGATVQTNLVKANGKRGVLVQIVKLGGASTTAVVQQVRNKILPEVRKALPEGLTMAALADQSVFVRAAINNVLTEGGIAAGLTALMILLFLGSARSTLVVLVSIPLSILTSLFCLYLAGHTLNIMSLGGLALAIGILVDDATVEIENIHRNQALGKSLRDAVLASAAEIAVPTLVSTSTICIVFVAIFFLEGPVQYLFVPFALAVVFAMAASYLLSRTLVPLLATMLLPQHHAEGASGFFGRIHARFNRGFERFQNAYAAMLAWCLHHRVAALTAFGLFFLSAFLALPYVGRDFYPPVGGSEFRLHLRAPHGTRLEQTERLADQVEDALRRIIPPDKVASVIANIGVPEGSYAFLFMEGSSFGPEDVDMTISLAEGENADRWLPVLRQQLPGQFPDCQLFFEPADMVTRILNFGLLSPVDVAIIGYDRRNNLAIARQLEQQMAALPGLHDVHLHQVVSAPELYLKVDRERAFQQGLTEQRLATALNVALSGSGQVTPVFWTDPTTGFLYNVQVQMPPYRLQNMQDLLRLPVGNQAGKPVLLGNVATVSRRPAPEAVNHFNQLPTYNVFAQPQGRSLGAIAQDLRPLLDSASKQLKPGNKLVLRGQIQSMESAFSNLQLGLLFAAIFVYLLMVVNFQSFLLPFIIITALPGAFGGIVWILFITGNTFNIPSLMGAIMSVGVATANSILLVTFAKDQLQHAHQGDALAAALDAGRTRLRPILMTALAMIMGMLPMSLALGHGSHQNAPLGIAVIGGLLVATVTTLLFVPVVFSLLGRHIRPEPAD